MSIITDKAKQTVNGKAFEYALIRQYDATLSAKGINCVSDGETFRYAKQCYLSLSEQERSGFDTAAFQTIDTMLHIEPGFLRNNGESDILYISLNTMHMILDGGWEISFRIHNASKKVEPSLKFDIKLLGNPPILFTQYLFK